MPLVPMMGLTYGSGSSAVTGEAAVLSFSCCVTVLHAAKRLTNNRIRKRFIGRMYVEFERKNKGFLFSIVDVVGVLTDRPNPRRNDEAIHL